MLHDLKPLWPGAVFAASAYWIYHILVKYQGSSHWTYTALMIAVSILAAWGINCLGESLNKYRNHNPNKKPRYEEE